MELKVLKHEDIYILDITGEIDLYHSAVLRQAFHKIAERQVRNFVINMDGVSYLDSSGIGTLIQLHTLAEQRNYNFLLCNVHSQTRKVLELTRLGSYFPVADTVEDAIRQIQSREGIPS